MKGFNILVYITSSNACDFFQILFWVLEGYLELMKYKLDKILKMEIFALFVIIIILKFKQFKENIFNNFRRH